MAATEQTSTITGTWTIDRIHSTFTFAVRHSGVATIRGEPRRLRRDARGHAATSPPRRRRPGGQREDPGPDLDAHLQSPDFFDTYGTPR